jgi:hypothetical protein
VVLETVDSIVVLETVGSIVDDWLHVLSDQLDVVELWDVTDVGTEVVGVVAIEDSVVALEVCIVDV